MKTKRIGILLLAIAGTWFAATSTMAAITTTSNDFSGGTTGSWLDVGSTSTLIQHDSPSAGDYDDGDPAAKLDYTVGMVLTGDGVKDDGGLRLNSQNAIAGDEAVGLAIDGTMEEGEVITFTGSVYNDNTSYCPYKAQLWNLTDDTLLADSGSISVSAFIDVTYVPKGFSISYTTQTSDVGDVLQIRFRENANNIARDVYVDNFEVTSAPPPASVLYAYEGFDTAVANGTKAETVGLTGSGFLEYTNTYYLMKIYDGLSYQDSNGNALDTTGKSAGITNLLGGTQNLQLMLDDAISSTETGVVYMSFLQQIDSANSWGMAAGLYNTVGPANSSPGTAVAAWRSTSSNFGIYSDDGINERLGPVSAPASDLLMFVVAKLDLDTGTMTAWINPTNLANVVVSATWSMSGSAASGGFIDMNLFTFSNKGLAKIDEIRIGNTLDVVVPHSQALYGYDDWIAGYGLSGSPDADPGTDHDGDMLSNLDEYGLGGNPTNAADIGYRPTTSIEESGGTNWWVYIYPQRHDPAAAGLSYYLELTDDLVSGSWVTTGYEELGTGLNGFATGFDAVTNRVSTETKAKQFIQLQIDEL